MIAESSEKYNWSYTKSKNMTYTNRESFRNVLQLCKSLWKGNPMIKSFKQPRKIFCQNLIIFRSVTFKQ
jgi:hypothetical protein